MNFEANDFFNTTTADEINKENERKRQLAEERRKSFIPEFYLKAGQSATLRFINMTKMEDIPLSFYEHMVWDPFYENWDKSRGNFVNFTCVKNKAKGITCPLCEKGDQANWVAVFLVIHIDNVEKDKESGTEKVKPRLKIWKVSAKTLAAIENFIKPKFDKLGNLVSKGQPLSSENVFVERLGTGVNTNYPLKFIQDSKKPDDPELIEQIKQVNLIEKFKPTEEKYNAMLKISNNWDEAKNRNKWQSRSKGGSYGNYSGDTHSYSNDNQNFQQNTAPQNTTSQTTPSETTPQETDIPF
jgi:hypothetical protein